MDVVYYKHSPGHGLDKKERNMSIELPPDVQAARYAHSLYAQRRIDIADGYTQQCADNRARLASDLADIALKYDLAPTRVIRNAFSAERTDFISAVRRALAAKKSQIRSGEGD